MTKEPKIVDVYASNFDDIIREIMDIAEKYPIIGVDTEFPGYSPDLQYVAAMSAKPPLSPLAQSY